MAAAGTGGESWWRMFLQIYFQAEQIDPAGMELDTVETAGQEVGRTGEEESMEGMDKTCDSVEQKKITGDQQV